MFDLFFDHMTFDHTSLTWAKHSPRPVGRHYLLSLRVLRYCAGVIQRIRICGGSVGCTETWCSTPKPSESGAYISDLRLRTQLLGQPIIPGGGEAVAAMELSVEIYLDGHLDLPLQAVELYVSLHAPRILLSGSGDDGGGSSSGVPGGSSDFCPRMSAADGPPLLHRERLVLEEVPPDLQLPPLPFFQ